ALIDFLPATASDGHAAYRPRPGGAPLNVCVAAKRLGVNTSFLGALSNDLFGEDLYKTLDAEKVDLGMVQRTPRPSTLAFVSKPPGADVRYAFFKENSADRSLTARSVAEGLKGRSFGAVHVSMGAITLEDVAMQEAFLEAFRLTKESGGFTSFDPNIRAPMITLSPCCYAKKVEEFARSTDVMKSSDADVEFMYGEKADLDVVAAKWLEQGPKVVVITRGPEGATAWYKDATSGKIATVTALPPCSRPQTIDAKGQPAPVQDTVGAGDTCMGYLLVGLLGEDGGQSLVAQVAAGKPWDEAAVKRLKSILANSMAAAAINCSRVGCDPPTAAELKTALAKCKA
ncbi:unnamed protein product, partial [Polarella glacialis]